MSDLVTEIDFAARLGLPRDLVAEIRGRALTPEKDWLIEKNFVCFTPSGVEKALAEIHAPKKAAAEELAKKTAPQTFYVARLPSNRRVLLATADKERKGPLVTIRVRDSSLFTLGHQLRATPTEGAAWYFVGRHPQKKGERPR